MLPLGDLLCASTFSQAAPCIPAQPHSPAPATQLPGGPCLGLLSAIREKPHSASNQGFLMALNSCSVNTDTKQSSKGLASCPVPMMGTSGSPARNVAALQAAPFCLPQQAFNKSHGTRQRAAYQHPLCHFALQQSMKSQQLLALVTIPQLL